LKGNSAAMGMAASQARLLSITARLSNNEQEQQCLAFSKQRLADNSEQINDNYLDALSKTKYQVLVGYNNSSANYADLTYASITGNNTVACGKQYLCKTKSGQVLVSDKIAKAFANNNGDFNRFLRDLGYTQSNIDVSKVVESKQAVHDAWDKYLVSVGKGYYDENSNTSSMTSYEGQHILNFGYTSFSTDAYDGYATYDTAFTTVTDSDGNSVQIAINQDSVGFYKTRYAVGARTDEEGNTYVCYQTVDQNEDDYYVLENVSYNAETAEFSFVDDEGETVTTKTLYADPDDGTISTESKNYLTYSGSGNTYVSEAGTSYEITKATKALNFEGTTQAQRELYDYAVSITQAYYNNSAMVGLKYDAQAINYYKNIFNEMRTHGYTTLSESFGEKLATTQSSEGMTSENKIFNDPDWMVKQLKSGNLTLSYYSIAEKGFIGTTLDDDESITEREDSSAMAIAEQVYKKRMDQIEAQDKQYDLQLNKLESEHNALQTEYEAVKKVISKNVEKSFNTFSA